jgi:lambda family phage portal protein
MIWPFKKRQPRPDLAEQLSTARQENRLIRARYEVAMDSIENQNYWADVDWQSAASANRKGIRRKAVPRSRYVVQENSSLAKGMALKKTKDVVGSGPMLQMNIEKLRTRLGKERAKVVNRIIENGFNSWAKAIDLPEKVRTLYMAYIVDGEGFFERSNWDNSPHPVQLDLMLHETEIISTPHPRLGPFKVDGIDLDPQGHPLRYWVMLNYEHSDNTYLISETEARTVDADDMIHLFRVDRPNQHRGMPHLTPALQLFAQREKFLKATVVAAETAANHAGVLQTDSAAFDDGGASFDADVGEGDIFDVDRGMLTAVPYGWKLAQLRAEHPATTFEMFEKALTAEVARCILMPFNRAAGNSSGFTFASGKLDRDDYLETVEVEQHSFGIKVMDKIFDWWLTEAAMVGMVPIEAREFKAFSLPHTWNWQAKRETDPAKQAQADKTHFEMGVMTDEDWWLRHGKDPDEQREAQKRMMEHREAIGMPLPGRADIPPEPDAEPVETESNAFAETGEDGDAE